MLKKTSFMLLSGASPLFAQDLLDPLIVTASRTEQAETTAPYTVDYIDAQFFEDNDRRTLPESLQYTPGVLVQKTAYGHGSPFIRGFTGRQNLLLVDGIRVNNSTYRSGPVQYWNTVDPLSLDHIELIKSQGSVLYGSDAVGGTLNAFGKFSDFRSEQAGQNYFGGSASYEYRTNGEGSNIGRIEAEAGVGGKFGVILGFSAKDYGDIESDAIGRMKDTGYPEQDVDFRFDWAVTPESTITFASYYVNQDDISRWHRTLNNPGWVDGSHVAAPGKWTEDTYDQERSLTYIRYAGENPIANSFIKNWNATISYQTTSESEFQNRLPDKPATDSGVLRQSKIDVDTFGIDLTLESPAGPGSFVYGLDYYHDEVDSSGYQSDLLGGPRTESLPIADDSEYDLLGVFTQYLWKPVDRFEITAGARYTYAEATLGRYSGGTNESRHWDDVVGSLRGIYTLNTCWSIYGGASQAFRAPNLDDLTGNLAAKSGGPVLGDPNVDPENFLTYELGTRHQTETTAFNLAVFYTDVDDLIVSAYTDSTLGTSIATNAGDGYIYGVELEGAWCFHPQWTLSGFAAWQDGRTEAPTIIGGPVDDKPNSRNLPLSGSLALRWTDLSGKYWVEGRVLGATEEDRITAIDQAADNQRIPTGGTPGYIVASIHAGWNVSENLSLTCGVENLTDEDYRNHGSGQNEPGINGIFGVKVLW
ncbi:MAG: TonB-dependent receptor [Verrucomicrobiota bacterium]